MQGFDIITDGEACRESYSNHFRHGAGHGVDIDNPGEALDRSGEPVPRTAYYWKNQPSPLGQR